MTRNQLLSTKILQPIFDSIKKRVKGEELKSSKNHIADTFVSWCNLIEKAPYGQQLSKAYFRKLENDIKKLQNIQTHKQLIKPIRNLLEVELQVGKRFIEMYQKKSYKDFSIDMFLFINKGNLRGLNYEESLEILTDLYLLMMRKPKKYKNWKEAHPNYYKVEFGNIEKRLQRITEKYAYLFESKEYKQYEKPRSKALTNRRKILKSEGKIIPLEIRNDSTIKKNIRENFLLARLQKEPIKSILRGSPLGKLKLKEFCERLNNSNNNIKSNDILQDQEFIQALGLTS